MATFRIDTPDGRSFEINGDRAPTEQEVMQMVGGFEQSNTQDNQTPAVSENQEKDYTLGKLATIDSGANFGFGRKLGGVLNAVGSYPVDRIAEAMGVENTPSFKDRYNEIVEPALQAKEEYSKDKPAEALALELGSSLINPVNKASVGYIGKGVTNASKGLRAIGVGGGTGAVSALGNTENLDDLGKNVATGTAVGTAIGSVMPAISGALKVSGKVANQVLGKTTGAGDVAIADAFKAGKAGDTSFLQKMRSAINAEGLEKQVQAGFDRIKKNRNMAYEDSITRLKQQTADKKLDFNAVINDVKAVIRNEEQNGAYLVDKPTQGVLTETKEILNKFYKDKERHNLAGFDALKKRLNGIKTTPDKNDERVKTEIVNSVRNQILKQSPEYKAINDAYSKDSELLDDLKKVFSLNRNANSETVLKKIQSTARNNANTDWGYRAQLLNMVDPKGEIQKEISANALNSWTPRGLFGSGAFYGGLFNMNPALAAASSPRITGSLAYRTGQIANSLPVRAVDEYGTKATPFISELLSKKEK